jgi:translation initiation factor 2 alpha subunit (eIF-2alpha)
MELQEGQIVLCIVDKIIGTTVFVKIQGDGEGTVTTSEIAPGRIRNLRDYVTPGKRIVCKILSIKDKRIQLSLRRVKTNEKKELLEKIEKENNTLAIVKSVIGKEESEKVVNQILETQEVSELLENAKTNPAVLSKYFNKEHSEKIIKILESKKEKPKQLSQIFRLSNKSSNGIIIVKDIINQSFKNLECKITYISAGKYRLELEGKDFKELKNKINSITDNIEKLAKKSNSDFSLEKD